MAANSPTDEGVAGSANSGDTEDIDLSAIHAVSASEVNTDSSPRNKSKEFEKKDVSILLEDEDATVLAALTAGFDGNGIKEEIENTKKFHIPPKQSKEIFQSGDENQSTNKASCNEKKQVENTNPEEKVKVEGLCKLMIGALSNSAGVIQVYPKFKNNTVIDIEDEIPSPHGIDRNPTKTDDKQAERSDSSQTVSKPEEISKNGISKPEVLEESGLPKNEDTTLEDDILAALVTITASASADTSPDQVFGQESQNPESNVETAVADENGKKMPVDGGWSQSNTTGSEEGSESGKEAGAGKRRGSTTWRAIAWAIRSVMVNPTLKIKVISKNPQEENVSVQDTYSSDSEQKQEEIDDQVDNDENKNINNKATQTETTSNKIEEVIVEEPKPGPSRAVLMVEGPEVMIPTQFISNEDEDKPHQGIAAINLEESEAIENDDESLRSKTANVVRKLVISRAAQTTVLDIERGNDVTISSSSERVGGATSLTGRPKHGRLCRMWPWQGKPEQQLPPTECPSTDEIHDLRPFPNSANISIETTTTSTQTEKSEEETPEEITICSERQPGFIGRIRDFMKRRGERVAVSDVENQIGETRTTTATMSTRDGSGVLERKEPEKTQHDAADTVEIEMHQLAPPSDDDRDNENMTEILQGAESADHIVIDMKDATSDERDCELGHEMGAVLTKQPTNTLNHDISRTTSNRATQTGENCIDEITSEVDPMEAAKTPSNGVFSRAANWVKTAVCGKYDVNRQLEETLNCDASLGLSAFTVNEEGDLEPSRRGKVTFVVITFLAIFNIWKEIRKMLYYISKEEKTKDQSFKYISIAAQVAILLLLVGHFILIWFGQKTVGKAVKTLRRSKPPANNKSRFSARRLRLFSLFTALNLVLGGYSVLEEANGYTLRKVWLRQELDLYKSVVPGAYDKVVYKSTTTTTEIIDISSSMPNPIISNSLNHTFMNSTWTNMGNRTANATHQPPATTTQTGLWLKDGLVETLIFGTISVALSFIGQITFSSAADWLLVICFIIWRYVDGALNVEALTLQDEDGNPLTPEELERRKRLARETLVEHGRMLKISSDLNSMGKLIWPALLLTAIFLRSFLVHLWFRGYWFQSVFYTAPLTKIFGILLLAVAISEKVESYHEWFVSDAGQVLLEIDTFEFERRKEEMRLKPISFGTGPTITSLKFIYSLFGVISSNVILTIQAFFASGAST